MHGRGRVYCGKTQPEVSLVAISVRGEVRTRLLWSFFFGEDPHPSNIFGRNNLFQEMAVCWRMIAAGISLNWSKFAFCLWAVWCSIFCQVEHLENLPETLPVNHVLFDFNMLSEPCWNKEVVGYEGDICCHFSEDWVLWIIPSGWLIQNNWFILVYVQAVAIASKEI